MTERPISRRRFLAAAGGLAAPLALAPLRPWSALVEYEPVSSAARLAALIGEPESAVAVGRAYLGVTGERANAAALADAVASSLPGGSAVFAASDDELRALLAQRIARDFDEERLATVDGWVFAVTEARLCGICALLR